MFERKEVASFERALAGWIRRAGRDDPAAFAQMVAIIDGARAELVAAADDLRTVKAGTDHHGSGGYSWADIGAALGVTRAGAQKRFGRKA